MAALDTPWMTSMSSPGRTGSGPSDQTSDDSRPPTYASFSPASAGQSPSINKQRSTILVHQKSPLLVATPPQVTRALAHSHPFIVPLNRVAGLLSWTSGDEWESFLLLSAFWAITIYGDVVMRWAGPLVMVSALMLVMYSRRYSLLSSTVWTGEKGQKSHNREGSENSIRHRKSLDEIVQTLQEFTTRCNLLLDPFIRLTDFLSTQRTATSASTRPALTALLIRIFLLSPIWLFLTLRPLRIITTKRIILTMGTIGLSWHSRPARVSRTILWRSRTTRKTVSYLTGFSLADEDMEKRHPPLPPRRKSAAAVAATSNRRGKAPSPGIQFSFILYENQRRWLGLGWTASMLAYERTSWTDEYLNPAPAKERFELPKVEGGRAQWRWGEGSEWQMEGGEREVGLQRRKGVDVAKTDTVDGGGWIYYDHKWRDGRLEDGWGRYTRRRKWYRDAELVEADTSTELTASPSPGPEAQATRKTPEKVAPQKQYTSLPAAKEVASPPMSPAAIRSDSGDRGSGSPQATNRRPWFARQMSATGSQMSTGRTESSVESNSRLDEDHDVHTPHRFVRESEHDWGLGDDARMGLS